MTLSYLQSNFLFWFTVYLYFVYFRFAARDRTAIFRHTMVMMAEIANERDKREGRQGNSKTQKSKATQSKKQTKENARTHQIRGKPNPTKPNQN